ncbi:hypothetical protein A3K93_12270 [Acinetobacter sp. NCu2D-2]|uniref:hypothetical protein n=1 Tax=Acinetobacter sp. NCu2D-2 TaxID=1608473 RepID=UPI0007CDCE68|nr:hypothetical protein [Acinetobacter sp. NCu2D-2]ANF82887.1 hypothetical protein A3K93_12270 [Acinetobacter sp. NCu2D-2]
MSSANKLIVKNSIYLLSRTLILTAISLYTVREILNILGVEGYGLFNLIFGFVALFAFVNGAMTSATQRFISIEIGKKNESGVIDTFYCSVFIHAIVGFSIVSVLFTIKGVILNKFLNINGYYDIASVLYNLAVLNIFITLVQSVFVAVITAFENMKFFSFISIVEAVLKLISVYILYLGLGENITVYGYLLLLVSVSCLLMYMYASYKVLKNIRNVNLRFGRIKIVAKEMKDFMGWNLIGNLASVLKNQGVNVILNIIFGLAFNASYALAISISNVFNQLINSVTNAINPQIYKSYGNGDMSRNFKLISLGSKYCFSIFLLIILPIFLDANLFLGFWLEKVPIYTDVFVTLALLILAIDSLSLTLITGLHATGKIKIYQIVVGMTSMINLPFSYMILKLFGEPYFIYYVSMFLAIFCLILRLIFLRKLIEFDLRNYMKVVLFPSFCFLLFLLVIYFLYSLFILNNSSGLIKLLILFLIEILAILFFYFFVMQNNERKFIMQKIWWLKK